MSSGAHSRGSASYRVEPGGALRGVAQPPGDKSISHRAIILAAIASGRTRIHRFCAGTDCLSTLHALSALGLSVERIAGRDELVVSGRGAHGLNAPRAALDLGNSGTAMRLLCGLLAGMGHAAELRGDASLHNRPMQRVISPLAAMGARIDSTDGKPPLYIRSGVLHATRYRSTTASAQVKSCLLLAGLYADGETVIDVPPSRDHTERLLAHFGCPVEQSGGALRVVGGAGLSARDVHVPSDISAAMFFMVGASIAPGSDVTMRQLGINSGRSGGIKILQAMGADICLVSEGMLGEEPVADIRIRFTSQLRAIDVPPEWVVDAIDEFPVLFVAAACAHGTTRIGGLAELRVKESDRISTMAAGLAAMGIGVEETADSISIRGGQLRGAELQSGGDHRVAMAFAMAGLVATSPVHISDCDNVQTSWPDFVAEARALGLPIEVLYGS